MRWPAAFLLAFAFATPAAAQDFGEDHFCRNGLFPMEPPFAQARVVGEGRLHFLEDMEGCPGKGVQACATKAYVIPGDVLLVSNLHGPFVCAFYPSPGGGTASWVETARLEPVAVDDMPPPSAWAGTWSSEGNPELTIQALPDGLAIEGEAYWPSPDPPIEERPGGPNMGFIGGALHVLGNRALYEEDSCRIEFTLLGETLIAGDNLRCGGMNVTFSAIYARKGK